MTKNKKSTEQRNAPVTMDAVRAHDPRLVTKMSRPAESVPEHDADHGKRLRDTDVGNWLGCSRDNIFVPPMFINQAGVKEPGRVDVKFSIYAPFLATHLAVAIEPRHFPFVRVERCNHARRSYVYDTPVAVFAVRVPEDLRRPVDRGGSLGAEIRLLPGMLPSVVLTNSGREAAPFDLALFGRWEED